jgi:porin
MLVKLFVFSWLCLLRVSIALADVTTSTEDKELQVGYDNEMRFGAKTAINVQLEEDDEVKNPVFGFESIGQWLQPWFAQKRRIHNDFGVQVGVDYNYMYQHATEVVSGDRNASSGIFRLYGKWDLVNRGGLNPGSFFMKVEHRHRIGDVAPVDLANNIGYAGVTGLLFNDAELIIESFNWQQSFNQGGSGLIVGRFDPNDYMDVSGYSNPWESFHNLNVLLNTSIALPDVSLGIGVAHYFNGQAYILGSINDANGVITEEKGFQHGSEFFKQVGIGWTPSQKQRYSKNVQITYWEVDEREAQNVPASDGIAINANWTFNDQWMIFSRAGWSDGRASIYEETYTLGFLRIIEHPSDILGLVINWGKPAERTLKEQVTIELAYKSQFSQNLIMTPSIQWLKNPAFNSKDDSIFVFGMRVRLTL